MQQIKPIVSSLFLISIFAASWACGRGASYPTLDDIEEAFSRPEFVSQGDGWAEARRRKLIAHWLRLREYAISFDEKPFEDKLIPQKYRNVTLIAEAQSNPKGETKTVTLSLYAMGAKKGVDLQAEQKKCDKVLFDVLSKIQNFSKVNFLMTESCIGLTAQPTKAK